MSDARKNTRLTILPEYAVERARTSVLRQFGSEYGMSSRLGDEGVDDAMRLRHRGGCRGGGECGPDCHEGKRKCIVPAVRVAIRRRDTSWHIAGAPGEGLPLLATSIGPDGVARIAMNARQPS